MNIIFPEYIREWITENKGDVSPARFIVSIVVEKYHTSHKESKEDGNNKVRPIRAPISED